MRLKQLSLVTFVFILNACGSGSNFSSEPSDPLTGVFMVGPVVNIEYKNATGTRSGVTNSVGEFEYLPGDITTFYIGDLVFPAVSARTVITPMNMARTGDIANSKVINIVRLLMTLDQDADAGNGITITDTAKAIATQVDFQLPVDEFASSSAVTNLIFNAGQDTVVSGLVSVEDALAYFEAELIRNEIPYGTVAQRNDMAIRDYLEANDLTAIAHESGMYYQIVTEGTGDSPISTSRVEVRYTGTLLNGRVFDQTFGESTVVFDLSSLISGWQIALPLLKPGGKGIFYLPSALAYGPQGAGGIIPPNAVLIFELELISFQ